MMSVLQPQAIIDSYKGRELRAPHHFTGYATTYGSGCGHEFKTSAPSVHAIQVVFDSIGRH